MLNQTNQFLPIAGLRFQSINVSEFNVAGNPVRPFVFRNPDGTQGTVWSPDPGRALITGLPFAYDGPPFLIDANAFKIPSLWGIKVTVPYFHDNSAKTLEDVAAHYARFLPLTPAPAVITHQDQQDNSWT
jgi:cytochrome c peroxidase